MNPTEAARCEILTRIIIQARALGATYVVARLEAQRFAIIETALARKAF